MGSDSAGEMSVKLSQHTVRMHDDGSERYEQLYQEGYAFGSVGVRRMAPEEYQRQKDHIDRDAWVDGYADGHREFAGSAGNLSNFRVEDAPEVRGQLFVDPAEKGEIRIRDCEGGMILVILRTSDCTVLLPETTLNPVMAHLAGKALNKAASWGYRIQQQRLTRAANKGDYEWMADEEDDGV